MSRTSDLRKSGAVDRSAMPEIDRQAVDNLIAILGEDPFERIQELREAGERKARAQGVAYRMERERKSLLARLASEYARLHSDKGLSEAKLDRLARADDRYQKHLEGTAAAIEDRELATSEYFAFRSRLEWLRAAVAHENALSRIET